MANEKNEQTTTPEVEAKPSKPIPAWRQKLYRVPILGTIVYVIWPARRTGGVLRRVVSSSLAIIAILGIGMAAYPWAGEKYPFFYKVPVEKDDLASRFDDLDRISLVEGAPLTRIEIPALSVSTLVVQGTSPSALRAGAGHYPSTPLPGEKGNVGIAGHRTTFGRPFNRIEQLKTGDKIILTTPIGQHTYEVSKAPWITHPFDWSIVAKTKDPLLTLTTCHPKGSANQRLVVRAKLIKSVPVRAPSGG
jgi:sortase A